MTNESNESVKKKGFTITIYGVGDYHPSEDENDKGKIDELQIFLKKEAKDFRKYLQDKIDEKKSFQVSSYIDNISIAESNDKYPENGAFDMTRTR